MSVYFAVRKGRQTGIFKSWKAVQPLVDGFFNAEFQQFNNLYDAKEFLNKTEPITTVMDQQTNAALVSYIGGAVRPETNQIAACALMRDGFVIHHQESVTRNMSNDHGLFLVGGQILGLMLAIQRAVDLYANSLECFIDAETYDWLDHPDVDNILYQKFIALNGKHNIHLTLTKVNDDQPLMQEANLAAYEQLFKSHDFEV